MPDTMDGKGGTHRHTPRFEVDIEQAIQRGKVAGQLDAGNLVQLPVLRSLRSEMLEGLARTSRWRVYRRHEEVIGPDGSESRVCVIAAGTARRYFLVQGREFTRSLLQMGDIIDPDVLAPHLADVTHVEALTERTIVYRIPRDALYAAVLTPAGRGLLAQCSRLSEEGDELLIDCELHGATIRLGHVLGRLGSRSPDHIIEFTHAELGAMAGLTREQVTRLLPDFKRRGLVRYGRHQHGIQVPDPQKLLSDLRSW